MGIWYFWEDYLRALDKVQASKVQGMVTTPSNPKLNRESSAELISRFLSSVKRMPKAWGSRPWTSREMEKARDVVANDLYRRSKKRGYPCPPRV